MNNAGATTGSAEVADTPVATIRSVIDLDEASYASGAILRVAGGR